jgi:hypothetical protein
VKRPPWLPIVIAANLVALVALAFAYPHLMVSPGALSRGHAELATDCFACHVPWRGAAAQRCTECHAPADIGLRSTRGIALPQRGLKTSFHQQLAERDCLACHAAHAGPRLARRSRKPFSHELLRPAARDRCESCHSAPENDLHRDPVAAAGCGQCHATSAWRPATFEHGRFFVLDRDHDTACATCHAGNDFRHYTCYGCHEHTPSKVRAEHEEEGIRDFENCVKCHRSADEESARRVWGSDRKRERD